MRLWSIHPRFLDAQGLVALWREALLAKAVLRGETKGYLNHPQLERFRACSTPLFAINTFLSGIFEESVVRGYSFNHDKVGAVRAKLVLPVTSGQIEFEWSHLLRKLATRSPEVLGRVRGVSTIECHPLFRVCHGPIESWERPKVTVD